MSQKNMSFEDMIKLVKLISEKKLDKKSEREISKAVSKFGRYEANEIMQVTYMIKGGANLRFSNKQNAIQVLGGREKAESSKSNLEEFILKNDLSKEDIDYCKSVINVLEKYIKGLEQKNKKDTGEKKSKKDSTSKENTEKESSDKENSSKKKKDKENQKNDNNKKSEKGSKIMSEVDKIKRKIEEFEAKKADIQHKVDGIKPHLNSDGPDKDTEFAKKVESAHFAGVEELEADLKKTELEMHRMEDEGKKEGNAEYQKLESKAVDLRSSISLENNELRAAKLRVEKYKEELENLDTRDMDYVEAIRAKSELKEVIAEAEKRVKELEERQEKVEEEKKSPETKMKASDLRDEKSKYFVQKKFY